MPVTSSATAPFLGDQQIVGKCLGYRLAEHLRPAQTQWRWMSVFSNTRHRRIARWKDEAERRLTPRQRLMLDHLRELTIDRDAARAQIPAIVQSRIPEWKQAIKAGKIEKSLDELQKEFDQQLHWQVEAIEHGRFYLKPDRYGRGHTNLTNLTSELRKFVDYHGEGIYDKLATITGLPRPKVKKEMFAGVLFNRERGWQNRTAKAFEAEFPNIKQELVEMKAHRQCGRGWSSSPGHPGRPSVVGSQPRRGASC